MTTKTSRSRASSGFNLAEVMVAFMLVVIALFALVAMQTQSMRSHHDSRESHMATVIAGSEMAEVESLLEKDFTAKVDKAATPVTGHPGYSSEVSVTVLGPELKKVKVGVSWTEGPSTAHRSLETIIAKPQ